ncbi:MAG: bifunctional riboflavin kinase/FAD synthetase [Bacteroidales bacterium]|nr:bifunctional riboflavin kinase/FAD synthetase [Bacteroidales bacterium]
MELIYITNSTQLTEETIATIGFFDGVHQGHRNLIMQLNDLGRREKIKTSVVTFPVHPRKILHKEYQPQLLNTFEEKIQELATTGIDYCYVLEFNTILSEMPAQDFMYYILKKQLKIKDLLIGYDHKFGKGRINSYNDYVEFGQSCGIRIFPAEKYEPDDQHISSTVIRNLLYEGKVKEAAKLLSYSYFIQGKVIGGNKIGRTIDVPTANILPNSPEKIIPMEGVYAVFTSINNHRYQGMCYIGNRPTISSTGEKRIEVNIFNFNEDLYGKEIMIEFIDFIRKDIHFENIEKLKLQLQEDKKATISALSS